MIKLDEEILEATTNGLDVIYLNKLGDESGGSIQYFPEQKKNILLIRV